MAPTHYSRLYGPAAKPLVAYADVEGGLDPKAGDRQSGASTTSQRGCHRVLSGGACSEAQARSQSIITQLKCTSRLPDQDQRLPSGWLACKPGVMHAYQGRMPCWILQHVTWLTILIG